MTTKSRHGSATERTAPPAFRRVLAGIDRSHVDAETARQAAVLAGPSQLRLVSVYCHVGTGLSAQATMTKEHAQDALDAAAEAVRGMSPEVQTEAVFGDDAVEPLLDASHEHDLVVVGSHGHHRAGGIMLGSVATNLAHRLTVPLVVARQADESFPGHVMLATDGSDSAHAAARLAARIAAQHMSTVTLVHVDGGHDRGRGRGVADDAALLFQELGVEPVTVYGKGDPAEAITNVAKREGASLLVVGARGLTGVKAFGSVSERVVHTAPCSVLVARHP